MTILNDTIPLTLAALSLLIGIGALILPGLSAKIYGASTKDRAFVQAAGVRDLFIALVIVEAWRLGAESVLFKSIGGLALISFGDSAITFFSGNRARAPLHFMAGVALAVYAAYMYSSASLF